MTGKTFLDSIAGETGGFFARLVENALGPRVHNPAVGTITWADLIVVFCLLLLVVVVNSIAATFLRRKARQKAQEETSSFSWRSEAFIAASKPLYLLIWIYGIYFALTPLVASKLSSEDGTNPLRLMFGKLFDVGFFFVVFWLFFRLTRVIEAQWQQWAAKSDSKIDDILVPLLGKTSRLIIPVIAIILALPLIGLPPAYGEIVSKSSSLLIIGAISWILFQTVSATEKGVLSEYDITVPDNLQARKMHTQVRVISKTIYVMIGIFAVASGLMLFEEVRRFGTSILASAGVIGIVVGFAAQKTIANLFAGFQLAMTQPIRLDDVVIVEGEWGRVEEITLTYVVVHIWDSRRLVVPLSYFIEKPFQNWTRVSAELLGSVFVWADYTMPIPDLRREVQKVVEGCKDWDRRFWNLQVTDANERAVQIRVLATASDSSKAWDLRCEIREKLIALIQANHQKSLPRVRADLTRNAGDPRNRSSQLD
ncbi:MAG: mechanosensitive ion channel family protein [Verrucomicrobiota bacterium]